MSITNRMSANRGLGAILVAGRDGPPENPRIGRLRSLLDDEIDQRLFSSLTDAQAFKTGERRPEVSGT